MGNVGVVMDRVRQRDRGLAFVSLRTQTQIDAEYRTFACVARQDFGGLLCQTDEIFAVGDFRPFRLPAPVIEVQQVDVGAVVQLVATEFAQGQNGETRVHGSALLVQLL